MKPSIRSILREAVIAVSLVVVSAPFAIAVCGRPWMASLRPVLQLSILALLHIAVTCGVMMICGVRKWWKLAVRSVASGVVALAVMVVCVEAGFTYANVFGKMALGEGGFVRRVGEARMYSNVGGVNYSVYWGNVKYANGSDMRELILIPDIPARWESTVDKSCLCWSRLLVGRSRILLPHGLSVGKISSGRAAVTCLGGIDVTSGKTEANATLAISDSETTRRYKCERDERLADSAGTVRRTYYLEIPKSCFREMGDDCLCEPPSSEAGANGRSAAAKIISGPEFLGRSIGDKMDGADEYDVKLERPFLFFPRASYFGAKDDGTVKVKGCLFWFESPNVEYAVEHVLAPVTNTLFNVYGVPLTMSPDTKRGIFWKRHLSSGNTAMNVEVQVHLDGYGKTRENGYESCMLSVYVADAFRWRGCGERSLREWFRAINTHRYHDPTPVDDWHDLSAGFVEHHWLLPRAGGLRRQDGFDVIAPSKFKSLGDCTATMFGFPFGIDLRTVDGFGGESLLPVGGRFLTLEPNCEIATNGWRLVSVNVNGRSLTVFGGTVRREFADESAATADLKRVLCEVESAANASMEMTSSSEDRVLAVTPRVSEPFLEIERIKTAADGSSSYQVHVRWSTLMRQVHIMTTKGCMSHPE